MNRRFTDKNRDGATRKRKPIMFLSVEGRNMTEKIYLRALNADYGNKYSLQYAHGQKTDLRGMWDALMASMKGKFTQVDGDMAFCICDADFEPYKLDKIREIKAEANGASAQVIVSNPSFELWYLNHFRYFAKAYYSQDELEAELGNEIPGYEKDGDYYLRYLKDRTKAAIEHSIRQKAVVNAGHDATAAVHNASTEMSIVAQTIVD